MESRLNHDSRNVSEDRAVAAAAWFSLLMTAEHRGWRCQAVRARAELRRLGVIVDIERVIGPDGESAARAVAGLSIPGGPRDE